MTLADIPNYQHPAFPQPTNLNAVIWRYMAIEKFEWLVAERRLYMARADLLGDNHEGTTPPAELAGWRMAADQAKDEHQRRTIESNRAQLSEYAEVFRQSYYVSCWQMAPDENVAMWDRYVTTPDSLSDQNLVLDTAGAIAANDRRAWGCPLYRLRQARTSLRKYASTHHS